jgi:hypothetical protein
MASIRNFQTQDLAAVLALEHAVWGEGAAGREQILSRHAVFAIGSVVVADDAGRIVGYAAAQKVDALSMNDWNAQTDRGLIAATHRPQGAIAYGVGMSALPEAAHVGAARMIIAHYHDIFLVAGACRLLSLGARAPGYARWRAGSSGRNFGEYLATARNGYAIDPELRLYQKNGFRMCWPLPGYFPDSDSEDYGVMIVRDR